MGIFFLIAAIGGSLYFLSTQRKPGAAPVLLGGRPAWVPAVTPNQWDPKRLDDTVAESIKKGAVLSTEFFARRSTDPVMSLPILVNGRIIGMGVDGKNQRYFDVKIEEVRGRCSPGDDGDYQAKCAPGDKPEEGVIARINDEHVQSLSWTMPLSSPQSSPQSGGAQAKGINSRFFG